MKCNDITKLQSSVIQLEGNKIISRKIISASISSSIFAILLGLIMPNPFREDISSLTIIYFPSR